jgi:hypothetical protein
MCFIVLTCVAITLLQVRYTSISCSLAKDSAPCKADCAIYKQGFLQEQRRRRHRLYYTAFTATHGAAAPTCRRPRPQPTRLCQRWSARAGLGCVSTVAPMSGHDGGDAHHQLARSLEAYPPCGVTRTSTRLLCALGAHPALRHRRCSFALGRWRRLRERPQGPAPPSAHPAAAVRHRPRPAPCLQMPSRAPPVVVLPTTWSKGDS